MFYDKSIIKQRGIPLEKVDDYNHWLNVWTELTEDTHVSILDAEGRLRPSDSLIVPESTELGTEQTIAANRAPTAYQRMALGVKSNGVACQEKYACVPLQFWFCRNAGLALPLVALQYHEVKVSITF